MPVISSDEGWGGLTIKQEEQLELWPEASIKLCPDGTTITQTGKIGNAQTANPLSNQKVDIKNFVVIDAKESTNT